MRRLGIATAGGVLLIGVVGVSGAPALAATNDVDVRGACSAGSEWRLKVQPESAGLLRVEFRVDSDVPGQTWQVQITDNGAVVFSGTRVTRDSSGQFRVRRNISDQRGPDTITATATNAESGETCTGQGTY